MSVDIAKKRADLKAKYEADLVALDNREALEASLAEAGLPAPYSSCHHGNWSSASIRGDWLGGAIALPKVIEMIGKVRDKIVRMEPADINGALSLYPMEAHDKPERYVSRGVQYDVKLRQNLFGEQARNYAPRYHENSVYVWVRLDGRLIELNFSVCGLKGEFLARARHDAKQVIAPSIPGSKLIRFGVGGEVGADLNYLFDSLDDLAAAAFVEKAAA